MPTVTHPQGGLNVSAVRVTTDRITDWESRRGTYTIIGPASAWVRVGGSGEVICSGETIWMDGSQLQAAGVPSPYNSSNALPQFFLFAGITPGWHQFGGSNMTYSEIVIPV